MAKEALQQLFSWIEASTPSRLVVVGPIIVGPTIVVGGAVIRSIVAIPIIAPVMVAGSITIAAMSDFLDSSTRTSNTQR